MLTDSSDKNILVLYPTDDGGYTARFEFLKKYFRSVRLLNYARHAHLHGISGAERRVRELLSEGAVDILLVCPFASDYQLSVSFFASLRGKVKRVFWFADDGAYFEAYDRYYAQASDLVVTSCCSALAAYKRLAINAILCHETVANYVQAPVSVGKDIDVSFVGDMRKQGRREQIRFLAENGLRVVTYGQGAEQGFLPFDKLAELYSRSRINLSFSRISRLDWINRDEPLLNRVRQELCRPREVALSGGFCLAEYSPGLALELEEGREIAVFRSGADLLEKARYYLAHPEEREKIAAAAYARALREYRPEVWQPGLVERMMRMLYSPPPRIETPDEIYLSGSFRARTVNSLVFSAFIMLKNRKLLRALETLPLLFRHGPRAFAAGFFGGASRAARLLLGRLW